MNFTHQYSQLPSDPMMLMSFVNTKLRDEFSTLDELCDSLGIGRAALEETLSRAGFEYSTEHNRFW